MSQEAYDKIITQYDALGYAQELGEPGHYLITSLLSVWKERNYPEHFKVGNKVLSEKCGTAPPNIVPLRKRIFKKVIMDGKQLFSYKSMGQSQPGLYKLNPELLVVEEVKPAKEVPKTPLQRRSSDAWDIIPFKGLPKLSETQGIAHSQLEILNAFGVNQLRHLDKRYYTPSTDDTEILYELFRIYTPRQIKDLATSAEKQNVPNVLIWIKEGGGDH